MAMAMSLGARAMAKGPSQYAAPKVKPHPVEVARTIIRRKPFEEIYDLRVERKASKERLEQLGVEKWSRWCAGECWYLWDWRVDEWVYIVSGSLVVRPVDSHMSAEFNAGDLIRFPKFFDARIYFKGEYEQKYKFVAYGDAELD